MADAVSTGASAAVEELATSPPTKRTSSISAVAAEDRVRSVSFLLDGTVIGARATLLARCVGVRDRRTCRPYRNRRYGSLFVFGGAAFRGNREPDLRCLLAIANLYRTLVGLEPTYVVWGRGCDYETAM